MKRINNIIFLILFTQLISFGQVTFQYGLGGNLTQKKIGIDSSSEQQYLVLEKLYQSTNGPNWTNNTNWLEDCDQCTWHGVTCDTNKRVTQLNLFFNGLEGTIPAEIEDLKELEVLFLSNNNLTGNIPLSLGKLPKLRELNLSNNNLTGSLPIELENATSLAFLSATNNALTGELPEEYCNLNLIIYDVKNNQLEGCFPACYSDYCTAFGIFDFSNNPELADFAAFCDDNNNNCPCTIANQDDYDGLIALYNDLDGAYWTNKTNWLEDCDYCNWYGVTCDGNDRIIELDLSNNNLNGVLPSAIGGMAMLKELYLDHNNLSGSIPSDIGNLIQLEQLKLSNNELTGSIPTDLCTLNNLTLLTASWNDLSGCFDECMLSLCGIASFNNNPNLPGGGDFDTFCQNGKGMCGCEDAYSSGNGNPLMGIQNTNAYFEALGLIESDQEIKAASTVTYDSGEEIWLKSGFDVELGVVFTALIDGCGGMNAPFNGPSNEKKKTKNVERDRAVFEDEEITHE